MSFQFSYPQITQIFTDFMEDGVDAPEGLVGKILPPLCCRRGRRRSGLREGEEVGRVKAPAAVLLRAARLRRDEVAGNWWRGGFAFFILLPSSF